MLRDRGTIKWTSMMLPEHVKMIRNWAESDQYEQQADMDEQQMEEWNNVLVLALEEKVKINMTYHDGNLYVKCSGYVRKIDPFTQTLELLEKTGKTRFIKLSAVRSVERT
ncbi:YolD-like family protein [Jeotgalibacillus marinus]|uniref:YolD-like family protein n=1 Tax=Jeotgalibacillus marinus TaxID=86667 RepID=A0ABV3PZ28_9BACL